MNKNTADMKSDIIQTELGACSGLVRCLRNSDLPDADLLAAVPLFLRRKNLSRILFFNEVYQHVVLMQGSIIHLGVGTGSAMAAVMNLRGIHEPYNHGRRIYGLDKQENIAVDDLQNILQQHEDDSPIMHIKKHELIVGDMEQNLQQLLDKRSELFFSCVVIESTDYASIKDCLQLLRTRMVKDAVLVMEVLNDPEFPGQTQAVHEVFNLNKCAVHRTKYSSLQSYIRV